jgi:Rieske Fe-S protein
MGVGVLTRRGVVRGGVVAAVGAVAGFLAARTSSGARATRGTTAANAYGAPSGGGGKLLAALATIPHNGGIVLRKQAIVLIRGAADDVHAFSAVCTHQGCTVNSIAGGTIGCPCHGSQFDATTGQVRTGPAVRPLPTVAVVVRSGNVYAS